MSAAAKIGGGVRVAPPPPTIVLPGLSFINRTIDIEIDKTTWRAGTKVPKFLAKASGRHPIDVGQALHFLGAITMPNSLSPASPALFWAWVRYYLAPTQSGDLRITKDFADLDPHQKGILSDDFGVAISTYWLAERLGGIAEIVDGRRFALQFEKLLRKKVKSKAKMGRSKTPDFVMRDLTGKWHVLECKGTQSHKHQSDALKVAIHQKNAIQVVGAIRGERLAASLFIARDAGKRATNLKVIDPDDPPLIRLTQARKEEMELKARKVAVARALGTIGLSEFAVEMSLPPDIDPRSELLRPSEASRVRSARDARHARAAEQARTRTLVRFDRAGAWYEGREVEIELPPTSVALPFRKVVIRQGVASDLIEEITSLGPLSDEKMDDRIRAVGTGGRVTTHAEGGNLSLKYGSLLFSEMLWK